MAARLAQTAVHQLESVKLVLSPMNQMLLKQYIASQQPLNQMDTASMDYELTGRNKRMPKKANHGARPNSHWSRRAKRPKSY